MQRAGRVGGNELDLRLAPRTQCAVAISLARLQYRFDHCLLGSGGDEYIDETGTGDFHFFNHSGSGQGIDQGLRDAARGLAQWLGQLHGQATGIIAMRRLFGAFDNNIGWYGFGGDSPQRLREQIGQMGFEIYGRNNTHDTPAISRREL